VKREHIFIVAEAGVNHNGNLKLAHEMIDAAVISGADAVKFQTFKADELVSDSAPKANYQEKGTDSKETQYEMLKRLELKREDFKELRDHAIASGIEFMSTPFDRSSIKMLNELGLRIFKIPSGEITNLPYLRDIGKLKKMVFLSTGMSSLEEVKDAVDILLGEGTLRSQLTLLHATTEYPAPFAEVNLNAMITLWETFGMEVGYSDHTEGIEIPVAAAAMGASVIEKHFTIDKGLEGPDHKASIDPVELKKMITSIRNVEKAIGNGIKAPAISELKNIPVVRKSIFYLKNLPAGHIIEEEDLIMKRPGTGISPMIVDQLKGRQLKYGVFENTMVRMEDFK
jgi:N,N'-diacetyllegionaminate synthase